MFSAGLLAVYISKSPRSDNYPFGFGRFEVLAGFVNALLLAYTTSGVVIEAVTRLFFSSNHYVSNDFSLFSVGLIGLGVNVVGVLAFDHNHCHDKHGHSHSHCHEHGSALFEGMYLHVLADALGSVSVCASSILIYLFGWNWGTSTYSLLR